MDIKFFKKMTTLAHNKKSEEDSEKEAEKIGILRGGSAGALVGEKAYYSQCGRLAQARLLGKQNEVSESQRAMFQGGFTLENYVQEILDKNEITYLKEKSFIVEWPGLGKIGMRPDFDIFLSKEGWDGISTEHYIGGEWLGIEVKSLASPFSVIKQQSNKFPFMKHLVQTAAYMTFLARDRWIIVIGRSFNTNQVGKKGWMKIDAGLNWYEVQVRGMDLWVLNENDEEMILPFTKQHVIDYYKEVVAANKGKRLMQRPTEKELQVDTYDRCKYCPMQSACNEFDNKQIDFESWLSRFDIKKESE